MNVTALSSLVAGIVRGDPPAVARAISRVETGPAAEAAIVNRIYRRTGRALRVGVTGPPGAGKSTLIGRLVAPLRRRGWRIGILAVDPTSHLTGGAVLGDRLRLGDVHRQRGVFVRSMASRGATGGLAPAVGAAADILDAAGYAVVLIETVGAGQAEWSVRYIVDHVLLVLSPEAGDHVQILKAGFTEFADTYIVNKADRPGADVLINELTEFLGGNASPSAGAVHATVAETGRGVAAVARALADVQRSIDTSTGLVARRQAQYRTRVEALIRAQQATSFWTVERTTALDRAVATTFRRPRHGRLPSPYRVAHTLLQGD